MEPLAQTQPSPASTSFAGMLAALAKPPADSADPASIWNGNDLGEDVVTLSYERALRAHARYKPSDPAEWTAAQILDKGQDEAQERRLHFPTPAGTEPLLTANAMRRGAQDQDLRSASVTIRVSKAECERLRRRATEAGVTVSAYLRSCTLEAETLRAQVKEALEEMRTATKASGDQQSKGVQLARVLGHIGNLWLGLSSNRPS